VEVREGKGRKGRKEGRKKKKENEKQRKEQEEVRPRCETGGRERREAYQLRVNIASTTKRTFCHRILRLNQREEKRKEERRQNKKSRDKQSKNKKKEKEEGKAKNIRK
jgi:hypothetical protein